jgi:hypothetical protein
VNSGQPRSFCKKTKNGHMNSTNTTVTELQLTTFIVGEVLRGVTLTVSAVLLILCFIFRNHQPLKSRSWFPFLYLTVHIIEQICYVLQVIPTTWISGNGDAATQGFCFLYVWISTPLLILLFVVIIIWIIRWLSLRALNKRKETKARQQQDDLSMDDESQTDGSSTDRKLIANKAAKTTNNLGNYKLIQFLLSRKAAVLIIGVSLIIIYVVGAIDLILWKGQCVTWSIMFLVELSFIAVFFILLILFILYDFISTGFMDRKFSCSKQWLADMFLNDDPLMFRAELYLVLFFITLEFFQQLVYVIITLVPGNPYGEIAGLYNQIGMVLLNQLTGLISIPGTPLFFTILWLARSNNRDELSIHEADAGDLAIYNRSEDTIARILLSGDKQLANLFKEFAVKEFSVENVLLYYDIQKYNKMGLKNKLTFIKYIQETYLEASSSLQVNLPKNVLDNLKSQMKEANEKKEVPADLFQKMMVELHQNLLDTYSRFFDSAELRKYLIGGKNK